MRIEYAFELNKVDTPRFSVEATEGPHKLFTLATLVMNVLSAQKRVDVVFHSQNPDDPEKKISTFQKILASAPGSAPFQFRDGDSGSLGGVYFRWLSIQV